MQQTVAASPITLQAALAALSPNVAISDVTLTGSVHRIAGSDDETGTVTLKAISSGAARCDLSLPSGTLSESYGYSSANAVPTGSWAGFDGKLHSIPLHNLFSEPAWFFPAFAISRRLSTGYVVTDLGPETHDGQQVEHISVSQVSAFPSAPGAPSFEHLSQIDFFLDSIMLLPAAITFNVHPDNDANLDLPVEVRFSDYRVVNGVKVPFHIQKFLNNSLTLDFQFESASFNVGLTASSLSL